MRTRDATIPLALWICAAICAHLLFGTGGLVVAKVHDDRSELLKLSRQASSLAQRGEQTFEVSLSDPGETAPDAPPPPPVLKPPPPKPKLEAKKKAEQEKKKEEVQKKQEAKRLALLAKKKEEKKPPPPPPMLKDQRIAVRQHVKPDQADNPDAKFIADQANHVDQETRATQTSHDRDDEHPSPGATHAGSDPQEGDSEKTRIAENENRAGEKNRAPGEKGTDLDVNREPLIPKLQLAPMPAAPSQGGQRSPTDRAASSQAPVQTQPAPGGATPESPEVQSAPEGDWAFNPTRPNGPPGLTPQPTRGGSAAPPIPGGKMWSLPGLGQGAAPGAVNTNLTEIQVASLVGVDNLRRLREADGERRRSEHRGSWVASNFDRWRSAIENYVSSVKPGNQTALNTAAVPFASYLNGMHNRIHPIFADSFLESLDRLPPSHPMNDQHLVTRLEIVLTKEGHLKRMGVVKTSGLTAFDVAALDSVDRAQPFGPAPSAIVSPDGNVYLHWEFHRDEVYACSTMNARPYILNVPAPSPPPAAPTFPAPGTPSKERGAAPSPPVDSRDGALGPVPGVPALHGPWASNPGYAAR